MTHRLFLTLLAICPALPAQAHNGEVVSGGFMGGLLHGNMQWDHIVPMLAIGLWAMLLGRPAVFVIPLAFPVFLALGAWAQISGFALPELSVVLALAGVSLGLLVALRVEPPLVVATVLVGAYGVLQGYAHGSPALLEGDAGAMFAAGFATAAFLVQLAGTLAGMLIAFFLSEVLVSVAGLVITGFGVFVLSQVL